MSCNKHDKETEREIMKEELKAYQTLIVEWARVRNISAEECVPKQRLKLIEESGELARAILKNDVPEQIDSIGDIFVVLTILAEQMNESFQIESISTDGYYEDFETPQLIQSIIYSECYVDFEILLELCRRLDLDILTCVSSAWNEIKDRKGKTLNGVFLKNE